MLEATPRTRWQLPLDLIRDRILEVVMNHHLAVPESAPSRVQTCLLPVLVLGTAVMGLVIALGPGPQIFASAAASDTAEVSQPGPDYSVPRPIVARLGAPIEFSRVAITTVAKPEPEVAETPTVPQAVALPQPAPAPAHVPPPVHAPRPAPFHGAPARTLPSAPAAGPTFPRAGAFASPLLQLNLTSPFGHRTNPLTQAPDEMHTGQDFGASCGTPVRAAALGTVSFAGWDAGGGGNRLVVDHGAGLQTTYNHLSAITVREGQKIARGQVTARVGTTGSSTGCHLHFEVLLRGTPVDPAPWL